MASSIRPAGFHGMPRSPVRLFTPHDDDRSRAARRIRTRAKARSAKRYRARSVAVRLRHIVRSIRWAAVHEASSREQRIHVDSRQTEFVNNDEKPLATVACFERKTAIIRVRETTGRRAVAGHVAPGDSAFAGGHARIKSIDTSAARRAGVVASSPGPTRRPGAGLDADAVERRQACSRPISPLQVKRWVCRAEVVTSPATRLS